MINKVCMCGGNHIAFCEYRHRSRSKIISAPLEITNMNVFWFPFPLGPNNNNNNNNNTKQNKTKQKLIITRHDCALCKDMSLVRLKRSLKRPNHFNSFVQLQTKTCSRKTDFATFDLYWGHDCPQFDSVVVLTKFESRMTWLTIWLLMTFGWTLTFMNVIIILSLY